MKTPCSQFSDSLTTGTLVARRPPNKMMSTGTPAGSSNSGAMMGHWPAGAVKREFGCELGRPAAGVQSWPCQSIR